jgi:hypothetical protein
MGLSVPSSIQRVSNSGVGLPLNPPMSSPTNAKPERPRLINCGTEMRIWFQVLLLSPVQVDA